MSFRIVEFTRSPQPARAAAGGSAPCPSPVRSPADPAGPAADPPRDSRARRGTVPPRRADLMSLASAPGHDASADARRGALQRRGLGVAIPDPLALRRRPLRLPIGLGRHVDVLGVDLRHDELAELDQLLELFGGHHVADLEGLHPALGALAQRLERLDPTLLRREALAVEANGIERAAQ